MVERAIQRANQKKMYQLKKEQDAKQSVAKLIQIRDKEIENSEKMVKNNQRELDNLVNRYQDLREHGKMEKLYDQLEEANLQKKQLEAQIKAIE